MRSGGRADGGTGTREGQPAPRGDRRGGVAATGGNGGEGY